MLLLEMRKNRLGNGDTGSWGVDFTQELQDSRGTKGSPMGVLRSPSRLFLREREKEREVRKMVKG
jgi:hypothetical protein